jgi:hypothetical protein
LMNMLKDPNLKKRLRKTNTANNQVGVAAKEEETFSLEQQEAQVKKAANEKLEKEKQRDAELRQNLLMELLSYMETPNGSIDELLVKANSATDNCRTFMFTLVRNNWIKAFKKKKEIDPAKIPANKKFKHIPCTIYRGREWSTAIEVPEISLEEIAKLAGSDLIYTAHMYRFDINIQEHVLDEIILYKGTEFPPPLKPFDRPEPSSEDTSLDNRKRWEIFNRKKLEHQQSNSAQYDLILKKLLLFDETLIAVFDQMEKTIAQIREMNDIVSETFKETPIDQLTDIVKSIPSQIKSVAKEIHSRNGIIIKDTDLKLTPAKLASAVSVDILTEGSSGEVDGQAFGEEKRATMRNINPDSFVSFGGLPLESALPLLQSFRNRKTDVKDKKSKRFTLW